VRVTLRTKRAKVGLSVFIIGAFVFLKSVVDSIGEAQTVRDIWKDAPDWLPALMNSTVLGVIKWGLSPSLIALAATVFRNRAR
jgi:hypothetical protein